MIQLAIVPKGRRFLNITGEVLNRFKKKDFYLKRKLNALNNFYPSHDFGGECNLLKKSIVATFKKNIYLGLQL